MLNVTISPARRSGGWRPSAGRLHLPVQAAFPLDAAADAHRLVETGHVRGKVVLVAGR